MTTVPLVSEKQANEHVMNIYQDIKKFMGLPMVPNLFKAMANNPKQLEATWNQFKVIMGPGELSKREKELVAMAVSATNNCEYCIYAHTAALKGLGLNDQAIVELMGVVGLYNNTNKFLDGLMVDPDLGV